MRAMVVPVDGEPWFISRADWNVPGVAAEVLHCIDVYTARLPLAFGRHIAMLTSGDEQLVEAPLNAAVTAMVREHNGARAVRGPALFVGWDNTTGRLQELSHVSGWRLGALLVVAERGLRQVDQASG